MSTYMITTHFGATGGTPLPEKGALEAGGLYFGTGHTFAGFFYYWTDSEGAIRDLAFPPVEKSGEVYIEYESMIDSYLRACRGRNGQPPMEPTFIEVGCADGLAILSEELRAVLRENVTWVPEFREELVTPITDGFDAQAAIAEGKERAGIEDDPSGMLELLQAAASKKTRSKTPRRNPRMPMTRQQRNRAKAKRRARR